MSLSLTHSLSLFLSLSLSLSLPTYLPTYLPIYIFAYLIARQLIPTDGFLSYPAEWRVRFIDGVPRIATRSLMEVRAP